MKNSKQLVALIVSMTIFGTVGIFSKQIPLPSGVTVMARSIIGLLFLTVMMLVMGRRPDTSAIRKNILPLIISGVSLGANWILFFEACKQTTVATATLSYYLAPTILVIASAFIFKEKITKKRAIGMGVTLIGMILVSGVIGGADGVRLIGVLIGIAAAFLYATVVIFNKILKDMDAFDKTAVQFLISAVVLVPYVLIFERVEPDAFDLGSILGLLVIGVVHTGFAYALYFGAATVLPSSTVAIYSYIDPVVSILAATLIFREPLGISGIIGAVLIIGTAVVSEINTDFIFKRRGKKQ